MATESMLSSARSLSGIRLARVSERSVLLEVRAAAVTKVLLLNYSMHLLMCGCTLAPPQRASGGIWVFFSCCKREVVKFSPRGTQKMVFNHTEVVLGRRKMCPKYQSTDICQCHFLFCERQQPFQTATDTRKQGEITKHLKILSSICQICISLTRVHYFGYIYGFSSCQSRLLTSDLEIRFCFRAKVGVATFEEFKTANTFSPLIFPFLS